MPSAEYQRAWRAANKEKAAGYVKKYLEKIDYKSTDAYRIKKEKCRAQAAHKKREEPSKFLFSHAKTRANKNNIPFDIELSDIYIPTWCPILGIPLHLNEGTIGPDSPSLDKIAPELGYVKGNVQVISYKANTMKNNATLDEMIKLGEWAKTQKGIK